MNHLKRHLGPALALALAASVWGMSGAASAPPDERIPPPLACLDVTDAHGTVTINEDTDLLRNLLGTAAPTTTTIGFDVEVAAPSCSDGLYHIEVYDNDGANGGKGTFLAEARLPGNGTITVGSSFTLDGADDDTCVMVQVTTTDARGRVVDLAPNDGEGGPVGVGCGGGGSVWK